MISISHWGLFEGLKPRWVATYFKDGYRENHYWDQWGVYKIRKITT